MRTGNKNVSEWFPPKRALSLTGKKELKLTVFQLCLLLCCIGAQKLSKSTLALHQLLISSNLKRKHGFVIPQEMQTQKRTLNTIVCELLQVEYIVTCHQNRQRRRKVLGFFVESLPWNVIRLSQKKLRQLKSA